MKKLFLITLIMYSAGWSSSAQDFTPIWPDGKMPNSKGITLERLEERQRVTQVQTPGFYSFFTSNEENTGTSVIICPPGGYQKLTYNLAGFQFAKWLNTLGVNAFVLEHRLPTSPDLRMREEGPIQDLQRAIKIIRSNSEAWNLNPDQIGLMGASAGGHLASLGGTIGKDLSKISDSLDNSTVTANFMILISPVIDMGSNTHEGSRNNLLGSDPNEEVIKSYSTHLLVSSNTPPSFLVHAANDPVVNAKNSMLFFQALMDSHVPGSLHIFPDGEHSIALRNNPGPTNTWTTICEEWLRSIGLLTD